MRRGARFGGVKHAGAKSGTLVNYMLRPECDFLPRRGREAAFDGNGGTALSAIGMTVLAILIGLLPAGDPPTATQIASRTVTLQFEKADWDEVLTWLAQANGLQLVMDSPPPGRFTYSDSTRTYTAREALALLREVLAFRGVTLVDRAGLLVVVRLVDDVVWELVPYIPLAELAGEPPSRYVMTSLRLYRLRPSDAVNELEPFVSPRGRLVASDAANRLVVWDTVEIIRNLMALLKLIDAPGDAATAVFRAFPLQHVSAVQAMSVVRDAVGLSAAEAPTLGPIVDFQQMGRDLGNKQMLQSFLPGFSLGGIVPDVPRTPVPTRISIDERSNQLLVQAEPTIVFAVEKILEKIDRPVEESPAPALVVRTYHVGTDQGSALADRLQRLFVDREGWRFSGAADYLVVHATKEGQNAVEKLLESVHQERPQIAVVAVGAGQAEGLASLLNRIFEDQANDAAPTIVAGPQGDQILIRGTEAQIRMIEAALPVPIRTPPPVSIHRRP